MRSWIAVNFLSAVLGGMVGSAVVQFSMTGPVAVAQQNQAASERVTAQEFRLVAADGQVQAQLLLWDGHNPMLVLADKHCTKRATFGLTEQNGQPQMVFYDEGCRRRASLDLIPDGVPVLTFRDETDVPRARMHLLKEGTPILEFFDPLGRRTWAAAQ